MKVLITRPSKQSASFAEALRSAGLEPIFFPVIEIRPLEDLAALDRVCQNLSRYDWVIFTSANAVEIFYDHCGESGCTAIRSIKVRVAAIGPKTAEGLQVRGIQPDFVPAKYVSEAILPGLGALKDRKILLPRAEIARAELPAALRAAGAAVDDIIIYRTVPAEMDPPDFSLLKAGVDWITFTSASSVLHFVQIVSRAGLDPLHLPTGPKVACIGPVTARAASQEGFDVNAVASDYTSSGLIDAILTYTGAPHS